MMSLLKINTRYFHIFLKMVHFVMLVGIFSTNSCAKATKQKKGTPVAIEQNNATKQQKNTHVTIEQNNAEAIPLTEAVSEVFVANPEIADIQLNGPSTAYVFGKKAGNIFLDKYIERSTLGLLEKDLGQLVDHVNIIPWTPKNLVECAKTSSIAMIPIDLSVPMQRLKPENRLLIMWRLGLPCLTSPSPAYARVSRQAGVVTVCNTLEDWLVNFNRLLNDPGFAFDEIIAGQNYLRENHNQTILLKKWDKAFESVMG